MLEKKLLFSSNSCMSLRNLFLIYLFLWCGSSAFCQQAEFYYVVNVKGEIISKALKRPLRIKDKISSNDALQFKSSEAIAIVMSPKTARQTLRSPAKEKELAEKSKNIWLYVKNTLRPVTHLMPMSSRAVGTQRYISDIKSYFPPENFVIIGNTFSLYLDSNKYPMNQNRFFLTKNAYKTGNTRLNYKSHVLFIEKSVLFSEIDQQKPFPEKIPVQLYYVKSLSDVELITEFYPLFLSEVMLKNELEAVLLVIKQTEADKEKRQKVLLEYVYETYGYMEESTFYDWLAGNMIY